MTEKELLEVLFFLCLTGAAVEVLNGSTMTEHSLLDSIR
jgi:hypothetical protein